MKTPYENYKSLLQRQIQPWLVWLSGLSASLQTEGLLVRFLVRAHAWVVGWVPGWGRTCEGLLIIVSFPLSPCFSLPSPFSKNKKKS